MSSNQRAAWGGPGRGARPASLRYPGLLRRRAREAVRGPARLARPARVVVAYAESPARLGGTREPAEKMCLPYSPPTCREHRGGEVSNRVIS